jgi:hypothetical protein
MELILQPEQIVCPQGLTITVEGFNGDIGHEVPSQVFIEVQDGVLRVHVWNGGEDPVSSTEIEALPAKAKNSR